MMRFSVLGSQFSVLAVALLAALFPTPTTDVLNVGDPVSLLQNDVPYARVVSLIASNGLLGGGDLSTNRTLSIDPAVVLTNGANLAGTNAQFVTVNATTGILTGGSTGFLTINLPIAQSNSADMVLVHLQGKQFPETNNITGTNTLYETNIVANGYELVGIDATLKVRNATSSPAGFRAILTATPNIGPGSNLAVVGAVSGFTATVTGFEQGNSVFVPVTMWLGNMQSGGTVSCSIELSATNADLGGQLLSFRVIGTR